MLRKFVVIGSTTSAHLKGARMAYLSVCSTAEIREGQLVDEVIYLAIEFQVAGFNLVIACIWLTDDSICAQTAAGSRGHIEEFI